MVRPRRQVARRSYMQVLEDRLHQLQRRRNYRHRRAARRADRRAVVEDLVALAPFDSTEPDLDSVVASLADVAPVFPLPVEDEDVAAPAVPDTDAEPFTGVALAIRESVAARVDAELARRHEAMTDEIISAMILGARADLPVESPEQCQDSDSSEASSSGSDSDGCSSEQSASSFRPPRRARGRRHQRQAPGPPRICCPNLVCRQSFTIPEHLDDHLAEGGGQCPLTVGPEVNRMCPFCIGASRRPRVFANMGNLVKHKQRCRRRPHPVCEIVADGSFGFGLAGGAQGVKIRYRCDGCGASDVAISHHRECPAQSHARDRSDVPVSVSAPSHEFLDLPSLSFADPAMPASSWAWLDALDCVSLPLARPKQRLPAWVINAVQQITQKIMTERLSVNPDDVRGTKLFNLIPLLIFDSVGLRSGSRSQMLHTLKRRVLRFTKGKWSELLEDVVGGRGRRAPWSTPTEHQVLERTLRLVLEGDLRKARQALHPVASAPADTNTAECLRALHPPSTSACPPHLVNYVPDSPFVLDRQVFDEVVKALPRGRAPGRSGWRYEDVSYLCKPGSVSADAVFKYCSAVAAGQVRSEEAGRQWGTASLIALKKSNHGIRPIAMGEVLRKLVSRVMLRQLGSAACDAVGEFQFGVARPGGLEAVVIALRILLEDDPANVILSVDVSNAYNTFDRFKAMDLMLENPALAPCVPFLRMLYGSPAPLVFDMDEDGPCVIESERGTQQGDPWSSLLFSLVHTHVMDRVRAAHPGITALSYQDDTNIVTDVHTAAAVMATVEQEFSHVGLSVNKSKCALYTRADVPVELECVFGDMTVARDGLVVLGSPLGSNEFMRDKVERKLEEYGAGLEQLPKLGHPQAAFKLLRDSFNRRAEFLARTVPSGLCNDLFIKYDGRLWETTCSIMEFDKLGQAATPRLATAFSQAFMPVRNAGLGLRSIMRVNSYAFVGSVMDTAYMLRRDPRVRAFFESLSSVESAFRGCIVRACDELPPAARALVPPYPQFISARRARSQALITEKAEDACFDRFVALHPNPKDRARLLSASGTGAGAWLLAPPGAQDLSLTPPAFITAVCRLLGLPVPSMIRALNVQRMLNPDAAHLVCTLGGCGRDVDVSGDHIIQCTHHAARSVRHRTIVDKLVPYLVEAGYHVTREDSSVYPVRARDDGVRKMDLVARDVRHGATNLCIDVSIVDATIDSNVMRNGGSAEVRLYAAGVAVKGKETHYRDTPAGYKLVPFIMEAHGALAQPAVELVRTLADRIAPRRAGLGGGAVTPTAPAPESTPTGVTNRGHHGNRSLAFTSAPNLPAAWFAPFSSDNAWHL